MDALSEVLAAVQIECITCSQVEFSAPWGVQSQKFAGTTFWSLRRGSCWLDTAGLEKPLYLVAGDLIFFPQSQEHTLRDVKGTPIVTYPHSPFLRNARRTGECGLLSDSSMTTLTELVYTGRAPHDS